MKHFLVFILPISGLYFVLLLSCVLFTGKNNGFLFLGIWRIPTKIPNLEEWDKSQSGNLVGNSLVGTCLTLPNLGFLWVFFKYPKISKNGNPLFFPVVHVKCKLVLVLEIYSKWLQHYIFISHITSGVVWIIITNLLPLKWRGL